MKKILLMTIAGFAIFAAFHGLPARAAEKASPGAVLFEKHCQVCHPDGGNIVNKEKTIKRDVLKANGINTPGDIVKQMRNPGPGMTKFAEHDVPDKDAEAIARYILKTFK